MEIKYKKRLQKLGYSDYYNYLYSPAWADFKKRYRASKLVQGCVKCGPAYTGKVQLHHRTYKRIGKEYLRDVIPLCTDHHRQAHGLSNRFDDAIKKGKIK